MVGWLRCEKFNSLTHHFVYRGSYPNCLHILTLLKEKRFREEITRADVAKLFMNDFYMRWLNAANPPGSPPSLPGAKVEVKPEPQPRQ